MEDLNRPPESVHPNVYLEDILLVLDRIEAQLATFERVRSDVRTICTWVCILGSIYVFGLIAGGIFLWQLRPDG